MIKNKSKTIHVGDIVKIIEPQYFVRCGYPLTLKDVEKTIDIGAVEQFVKEQLGFDNQYFKLKSPFSLPNKTVSDIIRVLAYKKMNLLNYGGNERKIYRKELPELKDKIYIVNSKKRVVEGKYYEGFGGNSYDDDYWPPELINQKHSVILGLLPLITYKAYPYEDYPAIIEEQDDDFIKPAPKYDLLIERKNVELLQDQTYKVGYDKDLMEGLRK